jgi:hypothetical protein
VIHSGSKHSFFILLEQLENAWTWTGYRHCVWNFPPPLTYRQVTAITSSANNFRAFVTALGLPPQMAKRVNAQIAGDALHHSWLNLLITL